MFEEIPMRTLILWAPFLLSLSVALISSVVLKKDLNQTMGIPSWDFSRSWASNISVVGGLVTLSALAFLPNTLETQQIPRSAYAILLFVFPLLAALAPLVYNFSRRVSRDSSTTPPTIVAQGKAYMFIVASVFTMWAAIGQLTVQASMIEELRIARVLPTHFAVLIEIVFGFVALGLLQYGGKTVVETVRIQKIDTKALTKIADESLGETHVQRWALL
jgi:hypothetical protein